HQAERADSPVSANPSEPSELLASAQLAEQANWLSSLSLLIDICAQWAHESCPHLEVLVWGMSKETPDTAVIDCLRTDDMEVRTNSAARVEKIPQQYFIKQLVKTDNGATQILAVSVPRSRIREDFPELDIISCDTIGFDPLPHLATEDDVDLNYSTGLKYKAGCGLARRTLGWS
ncbi:hypothetical protein TUN199_10292, partial [Pyrenophora tritici-repentis]